MIGRRLHLKPRTRWPRFIIKDASLPLTIQLEMYSPFIALDEFNSGLPATVLSFTIKNTGTEKYTVTLLGWLENKTGLHTAQEDTP